MHIHCTIVKFNCPGINLKMSYYCTYNLVIQYFCCFIKHTDDNGQSMDMYTMHIKSLCCIHIHTKLNTLKVLMH